MKRANAVRAPASSRAAASSTSRKKAARISPRLRPRMVLRCRPPSAMHVSTFSRSSSADHRSTSPKSSGTSRCTHDASVLQSCPCTNSRVISKKSRSLASRICSQYSPTLRSLSRPEMLSPGTAPNFPLKISCSSWRARFGWPRGERDCARASRRAETLLASDEGESGRAAERLLAGDAGASNISASWRNVSSDGVAWGGNCGAAACADRAVPIGTNAFPVTRRPPEKISRLVA